MKNILNNGAEHLALCWRKTAFLSFFALAILPVHASQIDGAPRVRSVNGIPFTSGGIGINEREALQAAAGTYNLRLMFSEAGSHALLADIQVRIFTPAGKMLLDVRSEGPLLFVRLPPGHYRIEADRNNQLNADNGRKHRMEKRISLSRMATHSIAFQWPQGDKAE